MAIIPRAIWGADADSLPATRMTLPATEVWLHHTVSQMTVDLAELGAEITADAYADMRAVERIGLQRFGQFSYSYCIHVNGFIMEGAGTRRGAHTKGRNSISFGVALIGNYEVLWPTAEQISAVQWLVAHLQAEQWLVRGTYPTGGHRDTGFATVCPGRKAYEKLWYFRQPWTPPPASTSEGVPVANAPFAAMLVHPDGGYLEIGEDGGVFNFGAPFFGSLGGTKLNQPIVGAEWAPDHQGYYLLGRDGGVFAFGSAKHQGNALWSGA
jgi:hypothetical protein